MPLVPAVIHCIHIPWFLSVCRDLSVPWCTRQPFYSTYYICAMVHHAGVTKNRESIRREVHCKPLAQSAADPNRGSSQTSALVDCTRVLRFVVGKSHGLLSTSAAVHCGLVPRFAMAKCCREPWTSAVVLHGQVSRLTFA